MSRIEIEEYALRLAEVAALRSEDPHTKVGAVALTDENRIIAVAYNGLVAGFKMRSEWWENREFRRDYMLHAEQNLCALFHRNQAKLVAVTHMPCRSCITMLLAHGVTQVIYRNIYETDDKAISVANLYGIRLEQKKG